MHNFHIPVMGIGYTIDTPVKVAHLGISSVISLLDDMLIEKMRAFYCNKFEIPYQEISNKVEDFRAKRITSYLNTIDKIVSAKFAELKNSASELGKDFERYIELLPDVSPIKQKFAEFQHDIHEKKEHLQWIINNLVVGNIDVNIMTKLDKANYLNGEMQTVEFNDAHAALRGFANSNLSSSIVLSAGMNPRLYAYFEKFEDFYPDENAFLKKKIILKVSDYRSALIQGKFFAKKGLWVSEYRIESGLNCGGHAFPTQGYLMGPILEEFKNNREELINSTFELYSASLKNQQRHCPQQPPLIKITAQGGVGTNQEHEFLLNYYQLNSVGWGSPFLLVPEVINVDEHTLQLLSDAKEKDLYLSDTSPLGVPFNTLRSNTKDVEKQDWINHGKPGSPCPKKYGAINMEGMCTGSRQYQRAKIKELDSLNLNADDYKKAYDKITVKSCICVGLGTTPLLVNDLDIKVEGNAVSVCPGPNLAYFDKIVSLKEMVDHIYGRTNLLRNHDRPNMFINELALYLNFLKTDIKNADKPLSSKQIDYYNGFKNNLLIGIDYYFSLVEKLGKNNCNINLDLLQKHKQDLTDLIIN
ncbi:MAG: hypothetical protein NTZ33_07705 [Bacteroidetes bacterium]|nr:hypothetical protein [Bacteroidota bacterium]